MKKAILFDLDGTLLPIDEKQFINEYFSKLGTYTKQFGYNPNDVINAVVGGLKKMYENNGSQTNEDAFWNYFCDCFGAEKVNDKPKFNKFYETEFDTLKTTTTPNPYAKPLIEVAKQNFDLVIISTNPLFPKPGTLTRLKWLGFKEDDFNLVTTYENSHFSKPNPNYFKEILEKFDLKPSDCILVGNDEFEDYFAATSIGIETYLVGNHIIVSDKVKNKPKHYTFEEIIEILKNVK